MPRPWVVGVCLQPRLQTRRANWQGQTRQFDNVTSLRPNCAPRRFIQRQIYRSGWYTLAHAHTSRAGATVLLHMDSPVTAQAVAALAFESIERAPVILR